MGDTRLLAVISRYAPNIVEVMVRVGRRSWLVGYLLIPLAALLGLTLQGLRIKERERGRIGVRVLGRVRLPKPRLRGRMSVEEALARRRSRREYLEKPLTLAQVSQILWSAQGITEPTWGFRTAPSAGATYPLEVYLVVREDGVEGLEPGVYHYNPHRHELELIRRGDYSLELMAACLDQSWVGEAAVNLVITAIYERTTKWYGERGYRYVYMEVGHVGENVYLQCEALGLGCVVIGAFYDGEVKEILGVEEEPMYVIPVGYPR